MHTSQAATTMTMIAKIWPSLLFHMREKAMSAMLAALSMSSRQSRIDERVAAREHAGGADREDQRADHQVPVDAHQPPSASDAARPRGLAAARAELERLARALPADRLGHRADVGRQPEVHDRDAVGLVGADAAAPAREHHGADGGDEQQEGGDLEGQQELRQQQLADLLRAAEARAHGGAVGVERLQARAEHGDRQLDEEREPEEHRDHPLAAADRRRSVPGSEPPT